MAHSRLDSCQQATGHQPGVTRVGQMRKLECIVGEMPYNELSTLSCGIWILYSLKTLI